jgi:hypothetical protein
MNQSTQATGVALYGENIPTALGDCPLAVGAIAQYAPFNLASTGYWSLASVTEFEDILLGPAGDPPIVPPPFVYVLDCNGELSINTTTFPLSLNPATPPIVAIQNGIFCSDFASVNFVKTVGDISTWKVALNVVRNTFDEAQADAPVFSVTMPDLQGIYTLRISVYVRLITPASLALL